MKLEYLLEITAEQRKIRNKKRRQAIVLGGALAASAGMNIAAFKKISDVYNKPPQIQRDEKGWQEYKPQNRKETQQDKIKEFINRYRGSMTYHFVDSLINAESNYRPNVNSHLGAKYGRGLCQVSDILLKDYNNRNKTNIQVEDLYDPETNIKVACWYLNRIPNSIDSNNPQDIYIAYNVGVAGFNKHKNSYRRNKMPSGQHYDSVIKFNKYYKVQSSVIAFK